MKGRIMYQVDKVARTALILVALLLAVIASQLWLRNEVAVSADSGRYDYVSIVSPMFLYKGNQGVLLLDKRNGNVWFVAKSQDMNISFKDPVLVVRFPLEKLDQPPQ
jgi:hypothetical protein